MQNELLLTLSRRREIKTRLTTINIRIDFPSHCVDESLNRPQDTSTSTDAFFHPPTLNDLFVDRGQRHSSRCFNWKPRIDLQPRHNYLEHEGCQRPPPTAIIAIGCSACRRSRLHHLLTFCTVHQSRYEGIVTHSRWKLYSSLGQVPRSDSGSSFAYVSSLRDGRV
jgi:hypothetical protein